MSDETKQRDDEGWRLQYLKAQGNSRGVPLAKKSHRKVPAIDRFALWVSTSRTVDGLWVGSTERKPQPGLRRVEDALRLIKDHDLLNYARTINNLERIWLRLIPNALAHYDPLLSACVIDERFVLPETTTLERIASTIVHEATHARLDRWGINYDDERARSRIEAICLRRELNFVGKFAHSEPLQEEIHAHWSGALAMMTTFQTCASKSVTTKARMKYFAMWESPIG
ncbi:hypothetical protein QCM77_45455 [Bradyrhizobium sp. SSUT18]|uniref:hypothetical protein n=1 Tax=unclassified Bradyrhizobium TaxID=2631580 RepID=UPI0024489299|nr:MULTISPECIES: hypothetical protein [unclassified Bradyrhizobium]MDH2357807.1 hypothetical protein [Bradyrhizobium sp. SSUT112]MDH2407014.1 hypothetical protein [Bradyrhizobium sp. SSUT18]